MEIRGKWWREGRKRTGEVKRASKVALDWLGQQAFISTLVLPHRNNMEIIDACIL